MTRPGSTFDGRAFLGRRILQRASSGGGEDRLRRAKAAAGEARA